MEDKQPSSNEIHPEQPKNSHKPPKQNNSKNGFAKQFQGEESKQSNRKLGGRFHDSQNNYHHQNKDNDKQKDRSGSNGKNSDKQNQNTG